MRIVQVTDQYSPSIGGTERHVARLAGALVDKGHQVAVITVARPGLPVHEREPSGVEVFRIDTPELKLIRRAYQSNRHSFHPPLPLPGTTRTIGNLIRGWGADVVHTHNWMMYPVLAAKRRIGVGVVHTLHDYGAACPKMTMLMSDGAACPGPKAAICVRCSSEQYSTPVAVGLTASLVAGSKLHSRLDKVLAISEPVAAAQQFRFDQPIDIIPTFIPDGLADRTAAQPRPSFLPAGPYMLFVGALAPHKGVSLLVDTYRDLPDRKPDLVMLGVRKPDTPSLTADRVTVVEDVPHDQVMAAWRDAHVGVVPSLWAEPWGQVAAEALTVGCPLVVSDSVGLADGIRAAHAGLLFDAGDRQSLGSALMTLVDDRDLAGRLGCNGRKFAAGLTVSHVVDRVEQVLVETAGRYR